MRTFILALVSTVAMGAEPHGDFVSVTDIDPSIRVELRYATAHNFTGRVVPGYRAAKCMLSRTAAVALATVQAEIKPFGLSLLAYDCYRPRRAVDAFIAWSHDASDTRAKEEFYPKLDKASLFKLGYIASRSGHSRGSTLDLTLVALPEAAPLEMGTPYDFLDPSANTLSSSISKPHLVNRLLLKAVMEKAGFTNYEKEWWHFTLNHEPYPSTYFDFEIQ